jgi:membrane protein CcdC involved in cytochrome C biogenesis
MITLLVLRVVEDLTIPTTNNGAMALLLWSVAMCLVLDWAVVRLVLRKGNK